MATETFFARTFFNLSNGAFAGRSTSVAGFEVTDGQMDDTFELGDNLTFGGFSGPYLGTMTFFGTTYPVMRTDTQVHILGLNTTLLPNLSSWTLNETGAPACFLAGTRIMADGGPREVETLEVGDLILTADGRAVPVKWVGRQTVSTQFAPAERLMPIRVQAGALGDGLPVCDLTLTADHALLIDGLLINAGALVNGGSIDWVPLSELGARFTVYHVETENHDIILAEGAPAETFVDYVGRQAFDNYAEYVARYGEERVIAESAYPRISASRLVPPAIRARLGQVAAA